MVIVVIVVIVLIVSFVIVNWWLISPYFIDDVVEEEFTTSISEQVVTACDVPAVAPQPEVRLPDAPVTSSNQPVEDVPDPEQPPVAPEPTPSKNQALVDGGDRDRWIGRVTVKRSASYGRDHRRR